MMSIKGQNHQTLPLMRATRPASGKICSYYLVAFVFPSILYPDARRVAPISACVSSSTRHKTTAQGYADFRSWEGGFSVMGGRIFCHGGENFLLLQPKIRPPVTENPPSLCRKTTRLQPLMPPPHTHTANSAHRKARVHKDKLFVRIAYFLHTNLHKSKSSC